MRVCPDSRVLESVGWKKKKKINNQGVVASDMKIDDVNLDIWYVEDCSLDQKDRPHHKFDVE